MGRIGELVTSQLSRRELDRSGGWESWGGRGVLGLAFGFLVFKLWRADNKGLFWGGITGLPLFFF